jgi:hypothetical protein
MKAILPFLLLSSFSLGASETPYKQCSTMVPQGKVIHQASREFTVKTRAGTKIKVEFERNGNFQEASGLNLHAGDEFEPGQGLMSLGSIAKSLTEKGHKVKGDWNLERDSTHGWIYELATHDEDDQIIYRSLKAQDGSLLSPELSVFQPF